MTDYSHERIRKLLRRSELLRTLPEDELDELAAHARPIQAERGRVLFTKNSDGSSMMIVAAGRVKIVSVSPDGNEVIHNIIEAGQVFGEMALIDGHPRSADAVAAIDSELIQVSRGDFLGILERNPKVAVAMMGILCGRIRQSTDFVEDAVLLDAQTRLLHRIVKLAALYGEREPGSQSIRIEHGLSQQEIGESVGLTRVSINRYLSRWRTEGLIEDGRGYLVVKDLGALESHVLDDQG